MKKRIIKWLGLDALGKRLDEVERRTNKLCDDVYRPRSAEVDSKKAKVIDLMRQAHE